MKRLKRQSGLDILKEKMARTPDWYPLGNCMICNAPVIVNMLTNPPTLINHDATKHSIYCGGPGKNGSQGRFFFEGDTTNETTVETGKLSAEAFSIAQANAPDSRSSSKGANGKRVSNKGRILPNVGKAGN